MVRPEEIGARRGTAGREGRRRREPPEAAGSNRTMAPREVEADGRSASKRPGVAKAERRPRLTFVLPAGTTGTHVDGDSVGGLVRAAARNDALGWPRLVHTFNGLVRSIACSHRLNEADVSDVSQAVWLRLATHLDELRDPDRVAGWLATTTHRESLRVLRQRDRATPTSDTAVLDRFDRGGEPSSGVARQERAIALRSLILTLPYQHQRLLEMLMREPRPSYREISDALDIPVGSIGPTRQRCLAVLRTKCISAGLDVPA
jgi:RNA polymerase sigma factor (sigma-70 family)